MVSIYWDYNGVIDDLRPGLGTARPKRPRNGQGAIQCHTGGRATAEEGAIPWPTTRETTTHLFVVYELLNVFDT